MGSPIDRRVFLLGSERSGTNLIRSVVGGHPELVGPPPPHVLRLMTPFAAYYGPLDDDAHLEALVTDALSIPAVAGAPGHWADRPSPGAVLERVGDRSLAGVLVAMHDALAADRGARGWILKDNGLAGHVDRLRSFLPDARFLYLTRDGRDVVCSSKRSALHARHPWLIARDWRTEQEEYLRIHNQLAAEEGRVLWLRYEDFLSDPEASVERLCRFLDVERDEAMLAFHTGRSSRAEASRTTYWENLARPVLRDNKQKYLEELTARELGLVEAAARPMLEVLGYPPAAAEVDDPGRLRRLAYRLVSRYRFRRGRRRIFESEEGRRRLDERVRRLAETRRGAAAVRLRPEGAAVE